MGRRKKTNTDDEDWNPVFQLGRRSYVFESLSKLRGIEVCTDKEYTYFSVIYEGRSLMYRKRSARADGRKMYYLTDQLARLMGFEDLDMMQHLLRSLQYWRRWTSPERLRDALIRYIESVRPYYD